jgi:hypothetical protein
MVRGEEEGVVVEITEARQGALWIKWMKIPNYSN